MPTYSNNRVKTLNQVDKLILERPNVIAWFASLEKEFALQHCAKSTRKSYRSWIKDFICWKYRTHCVEVSEAAIRNYCTMLAEVRHVAASTQNQAFAALLFFYRF